MKRGTGVIKPAVVYSEAFKMQVVRELESGGINFSQMQRKYGIRGAGTLQRWMGEYGSGRIGKVIRVERPEEQNEKAQLKRRVKALEAALANAHIDLALERAYVEIACERAGVEDVEGFKKKADGKLRMGR